jgi:hypothetical protein
MEFIINSLETLRTDDEAVALAQFLWWTSERAQGINTPAAHISPSSSSSFIQLISTHHRLSFFNLQRSFSPSQLIQHTLSYHTLFNNQQQHLSPLRCRPHPFSTTLSSLLRASMPTMRLELPVHLVVSTQSFFAASFSCFIMLSTHVHHRITAALFLHVVSLSSSRFPSRFPSTSPALELSSGNVGLRHTPKSSDCSAQCAMHSAPSSFVLSHRRFLFQLH